MTYVLDHQRRGFATPQNWPMGFLGLADAVAPFGGDPALQQWATNLATTWARRVTTKPDEQQREMKKKTDWLAKDYGLTLAGAQKRAGLRKYSVQAIIRAWQTSREQQMDFATLERSPYLPKTFRPPVDPVRLVATPLVKYSDKYPVAPLVAAFMQKLIQLYPQVRADTYVNHGGGAFTGRGFSIDLWLDRSPKDARGFYQPRDAVGLLRAIHQAARTVGAEWRVLYNDYSVARIINQETGARRVGFVGGAFPGGGLNWHGPHPLILHFHLDLAPLPGVVAGRPSPMSPIPSQPGVSKPSAASSIASLPKILADAVRQGAISMQVALAIVTGQRDANTLTNLVFYAKHPELPVGYKIQSHQRNLAQQWVDIKERIIRPLLQARGTGPVSAGAPAGPSSTVTAPMVPPQSMPPPVNDDRAYRYHAKYGGYSRYGGGRLETRLRELRDQGKLSISDGDIELLQRISHVETGGCVQALNSWDDVFMSIGFMQWPLVFGKLQRLIARAPDAFRRYGIELDPTRRYSIKRSYGTETPIALKGVGHPRELRSLNWAKRFYAAGLDPEIVAREAELALEVIAEERRKIEKSLGRPIPHYDESSALRALIQETNNHRPAWLKEVLKRAVAQYTRSGASDAARFLDLVRATIRSVYPEKARAAASKMTNDPKKIADAVARMVRSGENLIAKTATLRMRGGCSA
jgi:transposase-like protein